MTEGKVLFITDDDILQDRTGPTISRLSKQASAAAESAEIVAYMPAGSAMRIIKNRYGSLGEIQ